MKFIMKILVILLSVPLVEAMENFTLSLTTIVADNTAQWTEIFNTKIGTVEHTPQYISITPVTEPASLCKDITDIYCEKRKTSHFICRIPFSSEKIILPYNTFNNVYLKKPLVLSINFTRKEFMEAMKKSGIID